MTMVQKMTKLFAHNFLLKLFQIHNLAYHTQKVYTFACVAIVTCIQHALVDDSS